MGYCIGRMVLGLMERMKQETVFGNQENSTNTGTGHGGGARPMDPILLGMEIGSLLVSLCCSLELFFCVFFTVSVLQSLCP